jgi:hypothetical protein
MRKKFLFIALYMCLASTVNSAEQQPRLNCDSTCIVPNPSMLSQIPKVNISSTRNKPVNASCAAYAGSYGIPPGATQGNVILFYEDSPTNPRYGQVVLADYSGCSIPSQPITVNRQCSAYVGSYGIPAGAQGTFTMTTEGNTYKPNYGAVISTDTSGCYVSPPPPPPPPGCYGSSIQTWTDAFSSNGKQCAGSPPSFTPPGGITAANSYPGYFGATGSGVMYFRCTNYGSVWYLDTGFYYPWIVPFAPAQTCN